MVLPVLAACAGPQSALDPAGPAAAGIAGIWWAMFCGAIAVWLLVMGLVSWALYRGRNTRALAHPQRLIVGGGLVLPPVLLAGLLIYGSVSSARITGLGQAVDARVDVVASRWRWHFRYLGDDGRVLAESVDVLSMPRGRMVEFHVTSTDVIHSFWIPRLGGKVDAILRIKRDSAPPARLQLNEPLAQGLAELVARLDVHFTAHRPQLSVTDLLAWPGMLVSTT